MEQSQSIISKMEQPQPNISIQSIQPSFEDILNTLAEILEKESLLTEKEIEEIKKKIVISTVYNNNDKNKDKNNESRCKGVYKSGPKKGLRCETMIEENIDYCKRHKPNNNMGKWFKGIKEDKSQFYSETDKVTSK
jgi:hypothetical protein